MNQKCVKIIAKNYAVAKFFAGLIFIKQSIRKDKDKVITKNINNYCQNESKLKKAKIYVDMLCLKKFYNFTYINEYFMFDFQHKNQKQRKDYIGSSEYVEIWDSLGLSPENNVLTNKYSLYKNFETEYKRDIIKIETPLDYNVFCQFVSVHKSFLIKPMEGSLGEGIKLIEIKDNNLIKQYFLKLLQIAPVVLEELIQQGEQTAVFHNQSVNTVRIATFVKDKKTIPFYAMFRMGQGDTVVDNASHGGIACAVDLQTGKIISDGYTKSCKHFVYHPESNIKIKGYQLPDWSDLMELISRLNENLSEYKLVGWDMAYTNDGWVIVEGNNRPNINTIQMCLGYGLRPIINKNLNLFS